MFEQSTIPKGQKRWWTTGIGLGGEALLVAGMTIAPMVWPQVIPRVTFVTAIRPPGTPPPPPPPGHAARPHSITTVKTFAGVHYQPTSMPQHAQIMVDPPPEIGDNIGVTGGVDGGVPGGVLNGILGTVASEVRPPAALPPPEPVRHAPPPAPAPIERLVIPGGRVNPAVPIFKPEPLYPPLAKTMRVSGTVELRGVIGVDGRIKELRVISGHPLLAKAAVDAVSRWVYQPTLLNNKPVEVEAPITVTFRLN